MTTKVLFVDDEPNVLAGLRRMLHSQRSVWEMKFAESGPEALRLLQAESFDVVVSDMRMPGMDGAQLLTHVAEICPRSVRLVLSGQSEHERIMRAIGPAHQFLAKPCDPKVLVRAIDRSCKLKLHLSNPALLEIVSKVDSLPSLPKIYQELMQALEDDDASMDHVGELIGSDIAMSAKVLQLVNSSFFGLPQHVTCPRHAVSLLGLNVIRPLTLSASVFAKYEQHQLHGFDLEGMIYHGLEVATAAKRLAQIESDDHHLIDDAFIAGMLHDVGQLILVAYLPDAYQEIQAMAAKDGIAVWRAEERVVGTTHAEIGAHLLTLWGLPDPIVEAVAFHHRPSESGSSAFSPLTAVHFSDFFESPAGLSEVIDEHRLDIAYAKKLGIAAKLDRWREVLNAGAMG